MQCLEDGIVFGVSANGVILTEGIDGVLPSDYFLYIKELKVRACACGFVFVVCLWRVFRSGFTPFPFPSPARRPSRRAWQTYEIIWPEDYEEA